MLGGFRHSMFILHEYLLDVPWHGQVDCAVVVIPFKLDAAVEISGPILGEFVFLLDACDEMLGMFFTNIFYAEVVDNQSERYRTRVMLPQARSIIALVVSMG